MILVLREERITSTAGSFCACVFDDACVQNHLDRANSAKGPRSLCSAPGVHRHSPWWVLPKTPRPSATNCPRSHMSFSAVLRYFLETPRRMARNLVSKPRPEATTMGAVALAFFRLEVSSSSLLSRPTIASRAGAAGTQSPGGVDHEISLN